MRWTAIGNAVAARLVLASARLDRTLAGAALLRSLARR